MKHITQDHNTILYLSQIKPMNGDNVTINNDISKMEKSFPKKKTSAFNKMNCIVSKNINDSI